MVIFIHYRPSAISLLHIRELFGTRTLQSQNHLATVDLVLGDRHPSAEA
jgi:hypothetical protein